MPPDHSDEGRWFAKNLFPHEPMLRAWLKSRFGPSVVVNDVIQEAYLKILQVRQHDPVKAPKAFLFTTARNIALNAARHAKVRSENNNSTWEDVEVLDEAPDAGETVARYEELEMLTQAIQALPDRCRQIFTLRKVYGMSQADIARELDISARTVNAQISIGLNKCAEFVGRFRKGHRA